MAWTITNWANADWSAAATLNEFVGAVNERKLAMGQGGPVPTVNAGDDVQTRSFLLQFQQWAEDSLGSFVAAWAGGEALGAGWYDGAATIPHYASLAAVFAAAGLGYSDWRRYTTHPDEAGSVAYGQMQAGDIIGPWIFEDLQKILNVLVWTKRDIGWTEKVWYSSEEFAFSWASAKAAAEAAWSIMEVSVSPAAASRGTYYSASSYGALLSHSEASGQVANVWNGVTRHADWYIKAEAAGGDSWDDYGDDVLEGLFSLWSQDEPATDGSTIISGTKLGTASVMPNTPWCAEPTPAATWTWRGWRILATGVVLRWNVFGGFNYQ